MSALSDNAIVEHALACVHRRASCRINIPSPWHFGRAGPWDDSAVTLGVLLYTLLTLYELCTVRRYIRSHIHIDETLITNVPPSLAYIQLGRRLQHRPSLPKVTTPPARCDGYLPILYTALTRISPDVKRWGFFRLPHATQDIPCIRKCAWITCLCLTWTPV